MLRLPAFAATASSTTFATAFATAFVAFFAALFAMSEVPRLSNSIAERYCIAGITPSRRRDHTPESWLSRCRLNLGHLVMRP
jgi:hypothetical protein